MGMRTGARIGIVAAAWLAACSSSSKAPDVAGAPSSEPQKPASDIKELILRTGASSVDELLPHLDSDLVSHSVLLHASGSLHVASYATPRVVLHSSDGKLSLAFNSGTTGQTGDQSLEILRFDEASDRFVLSEVKFPIDQIAEPVFSEDDPPRCTGCHDIPVRPNWGSYPTWTGAYGENGDKVAQGSDEAKGLEAFLASVGSHPRYKFLKNVTERYAVDASGKLVAAPNAALLDAFAKLNVRRLATEVRASSAYASHRDEVIALLSGCKGSHEDLVAAAARLGLTIDLNNWSMVFSGTDDEHRTKLTVPPFQDATGDYLSREFFPVMREKDPALASRDGPCS
jgi:hypothetical protein